MGWAGLTVTVGARSYPQPTHLTHGSGTAARVSALLRQCSSLSLGWEKASERILEGAKVSHILVGLFA